MIRTPDCRKVGEARLSRELSAIYINCLGMERPFNINYMDLTGVNYVIWIIHNLLEPPMSEPIRLYAVKLFASEYERLSFATGSETLSSGFQYVGIQFHQTQESAQADVDSEAHMAWIHASAETDSDGDLDSMTSEKLEAEKGVVVEIQLHRNGKIVDASGFDLTEYIGQAQNQTHQQVVENLMALYEDQFQRLKNEPSHDSDGPGF
jgi:hypothetical protein